MAEAKSTAIEPGIVARVAAGLRFIASSKLPDWFGPGTPLTPVVSDAQKPSVEGRQFDYPFAINMQTRPRTGEAVSFQQMRNLADCYDLMRLVIETRKDQIEALKWNIKPKDAKAKTDSRCEELTKFFLFPDKEHNWSTWLRMLLEDLLVIDAPTLYPRKTLGGQLYSLEPVDGATIKRVLDERGRTPLPPEPAFQQYLKGMPAINYSRDELIYSPRNPRTNKVYGYSPVEQVIVTVNIALQRQAHQLGYYTDGSTPDLIFQVPETWQPDQIAQFEAYWNAALAGDSAARRGAKFVPKGVEPYNTKEAALKDEYDEWLARIVCFAFSISPQPFIKEMNRATAQTGQESAAAEGLEPLKNWVKWLIDGVIVNQFGFADIEFAWLDEETTKPLDQSVIDKNYVEAKILHPDEVRERRFGMPALTPEQKADMSPAPALPDPSDSEAADPEKGSPADKVAKAKKQMRPIDRERPAVVRARAKISKIIKAHFESLLDGLQAVALGDDVGKDDDGGRDYDDQAFEAVIQQADYNAMTTAIAAQLEALAKDGVAEGFAHIGVNPDADTLSQANHLAVSYANDRGAELVGMKWVDGELVPNPDARWVITDTTRAKVKALVEKATEDGWSPQKLSDALADSAAFGKARAMMIARTECAWADAHGNLSAYQESGEVEGKRSILGTNEDHGENDILNAKQGVIPVDKAFQSGHQAPPYHPNCICDVLPVLIDE